MEVCLEDLKREITLDSYVEEQLNEFTDLNTPAKVADVRQRLEAFVRKVRSHAQPVDTWWEWVKGTDALSQQGGLALIRKGEVVWNIMTWKS